MALQWWTTACTYTTTGAFPLKAAVRALCHTARNEAKTHTLYLQSSPADKIRSLTEFQSTFKMIPSWAFHYEGGKITLLKTLEGNFFSIKIFFWVLFLLTFFFFFFFFSWGSHCVAQLLNSSDTPAKPAKELGQLQTLSCSACHLFLVHFFFLLSPSFLLGFLSSLHSHCATPQVRCSFPFTSWEATRCPLYSSYAMNFLHCLNFSWELLAAKLFQD